MMMVVFMHYLCAMCLAVGIVLESTGPIVEISVIPALPAGASLSVDIGSTIITSSVPLTEFTFDLTGSLFTDSSVTVRCAGCGQFLVDTDGDGVPETPGVAIIFTYTGAPQSLLCFCRFCCFCRF